MKISVEQKQREVYLEKGALLLEEVLTSDQQEAILAAAGVLDDSSGRDLWRKSPVLKKMAAIRPVVDVAAQLMGERLIRLGYDQYLPKLDGVYGEWLQGVFSLNDLSSYRGSVCAALIPLTGNGDALFIRPEWKMELAEWVDLNAPYYLLFYAAYNAQYVLNKSDPEAACMGRLGYVSGDRLKEGINPIVRK